MEDDKKTTQSSVITPSSVKGSGMLKKIPKSSKNKETVLIVLGSLLVVLLGVATGWFLSGKKVGGGKAETSQKMEESIIQSDTEAGIEDGSILPDEAEGDLVEGGIEGEGTHHLERFNDPTKSVYLTSTVIDLQSFVGKKVKVWGETISGQTAGWLMDVGRIKVVE